MPMQSVPHYRIHVKKENLGRKTSANVVKPHSQLLNTEFKAVQTGFSSLFLSFPLPCKESAHSLYKRELK